MFLDSTALYTITVNPQNKTTATSSAVSDPGLQFNFSLWAGGMEAIPVTLHGAKHDVISTFDLWFLNFAIAAVDKKQERVAVA